VNEDALKRTVLGLCGHLHLLVAHFRPGRTVEGWRTPVEADGKGYPDLTIVGPAGAGVMWRELKADGKYPDADQRVWLQRLDAAGCDVAVWRPRDLLSGRIERELKSFAKSHRIGV